MNIRHTLEFERIYYNYNEFKSPFMKSKSITRNENIQLPKSAKAVSKTTNSIIGTRIFSSLPNEMKTLDIGK